MASGGGASGGRGHEPTAQAVGSIGSLGSVGVGTGALACRRPTHGSSPDLSAGLSGLAVGVRGTSGAITMERSEDERLKYPDRINLDRKGLHGIPILEAEPGLRLLSLQHNFIKRIQHLDSTYRLVFLDLYHNRLDVISNLELLINLRVLMLGKNRIRRIEGLQRCNRLSVLDLHGNRITQITGLDNLTELKVLNLAGNLIRKLTNLQGLMSLEELNIRRNRIRSTEGLEVVPTLEKLYMSNNDIQGISSLQKLEALVKLHTVQMEGNPVWSSSEYAYHLATCLPELRVLDQQEIAPEVRANALRWKAQQTPATGAGAGSASAVSLPSVPAAPVAAIGSPLSASPSMTAIAGTSGSAAKKHLLKKMEERNVSISNAKSRWEFAMKQTSHIQAWKNIARKQVEAGRKGNPKFSIGPKGSARKLDVGEEQADDLDDEVSFSPTTTLDYDSSILSPSVSTPHLLSLSLSRQASRNNLLAKLNVPGAAALLSNASGGDRSKSSPGSPNSCRSLSTRSGSDSESRHLVFPPVPIKNESVRRRFPGLERRRFALPQKFVCLHQVSDVEGAVSSPVVSSSKAYSFANVEKKIGFFHTPSSAAAAADDGQSTSDEFSGNGLLSDSSSEASSSDAEDNNLLFPRPQSQANNSSLRRIHSSTDVDKLRRHTPTPRSLRADASPVPAAGLQAPADGNRARLRSVTSTRTAPSASTAAAAAALTAHSDTGRTSEQGRDYLIELDGDLLSVYGLQSLKFLDRSWNRSRALKATTVQFHFISFDDLVPFLPKFRQTFPNVDNFEFLETDIHSLNQLNALSLVQGITSLFIGDEGNPIFHKNWRAYAIYRLEHWGLQYINNSEISDEDILESNRTYGSLGELAIMVMSPGQITALVRKFELVPKELLGDAVIDLASIRDPNVKEIVAKEALHYKPKTMADQEAEAKNLQALESLLEVGHSAFHRIGRLEDEWDCILPILVKRIVSQYSDIRQYKKESLGKLEKVESFAQRSA